MKILSAIVLFCWMSCLVHCSMEPCSAVSEATCCASHDCHEGETEGEHENHAPTTKDCEICDYLASGAPLTVKVVVESWVALAEVSILLPDFMLIEGTARHLEAMPDHSPPIRRLCEFLARTACPVRGPDSALI